MTGPKAQITVLIADPQPLVAQAFSRALSGLSGVSVSKQNPTSALDTLDDVITGKPDVAVIDYWMADMEGAALTRLIRARQPERKIVLLGWFNATREVEAARRAGAMGFLHKSAGIEDLFKMVVGVAEAPVSEKIRPATKAAQAEEEIWNRLSGLTRRQIETIGLISMNISFPAVGKNLGISAETVKVHLRNIFSKTGYKSQKEVVAKARQVGLIRN